MTASLVPEDFSEENEKLGPTVSDVEAQDVDSQPLTTRNRGIALPRRESIGTGQTTRSVNQPARIIAEFRTLR